MERICKHHGLTNFSKQSSKGKISFYCVKCYIDRQRNNRRNKKLKAIEYMGGKCCRCGYNKSPSALDFHHKDPSQKDPSCDYRSWSWDRLKNELDKCILVCANCHREIHEEIINSGLEK